MKKKCNWFLVLVTALLLQCTAPGIKKKNEKQVLHSANTITVPTLLVNGTNTHIVARAYRIAIGDITGNIQYHQSGILKQPEPCLYAGLVYGKPWTRDAAINVWNGVGLLATRVSENTLLAQVEINADKKYVISGQYWDKIIWTIGAWHYYLYTGDTEFLEFVYHTVKNTLNQLEKDEFSPEYGLFRGPAVYGDGVSAYPEIYTNHQSAGKRGSYSGIYQWAEVNALLKHPKGYGMPMHTLSTNSVYCHVYGLLSTMATELDIEQNNNWELKAGQLRKSINLHFWNDKKKNYNYLIDSFGNCDIQEGLGIAFCLLFDIINSDKVEDVFETTVVEPAGIPCLYPSFTRYRNDLIDSYGRHSGTVWPHIQGFWADAAKKFDHHEIFLHEFNALTENAVRDFQFVEIYHPTKKTPYGGIQEPHLEEWTEWFCAERQTWSATAYIRMILKNIIGLNFSVQGIKFDPYLPEKISKISLLGLKYRNSILDINITGSGSVIDYFSINGVESNIFFLEASSNGNITVEIKLSKE